jgi:hypothetical protein
MIAAILLAIVAADYSGTWIGTDSTLAFRFEQHGTKLHGKQYEDFRTNNMQQGIVSGDVLRFTIRVREQAGNDMLETTIRYYGKRTGNDIDLTAERQTARRSRIQRFRLTKLH